MELAGIVAGGSASSVAETTQKRTQLTREEFFKVLTAQLTQQNPLEPMDSQDFLAQLVQLQNLEVTADLSNNFAGMLTQNALSSAGSLLGRSVRGTADSGDEATGSVRSISVDEGKVRLRLDEGSVMSLENVTEISDLVS